MEDAGDNSKKTLSPNVYKTLEIHCHKQVILSIVTVLRRHFGENRIRCWLHHHEERGP